ncbi:MAG: hypothetical protein R2780_11790 [Crocinitomicaceae bacterium]
MRKISIIIFILSISFGCSQQTEDSPHKYSSVIANENPVSDSTQTDTTQVDASNSFKNEMTEEIYLLHESLPDWFVQTDLLNVQVFNNDYLLDNRLNPFYFEEDFNGDGMKDIVIPIKEISSGKVGFAIIHGKTNDVYIVGAGKKPKNGLIDSDDMKYRDQWRINRKKENLPGVDGNEPLILDNPSIELRTLEIGGGLIYWNGKEYAYFHQAC